MSRSVRGETAFGSTALSALKGIIDFDIRFSDATPSPGAP
jgi:hypothetical protein